MKIDFKGLKFKNWMYLMLFSILILAVLWVLQFTLLNSFYVSMKENELINIGDKILENYNNHSSEEIMRNYAFKNNLRVIELDTQGNIKTNYDAFGGPGLKDAVFPKEEFKTLLKEFSESSSAQIHYLNEQNQAFIGDKKGKLGQTPISEEKQVVYVAKITDKNNAAGYLYISSPIPSIDSTMSVLKTQFVIITILLLVLSLIVAQLISRRMSKPIIKLTKSAEGMSKGNLNVDFYNGGFTEIHQLASTLSYATDELSKLDNYRKEFLANVSHDLKTPLTIIKVYGEMIRDVSGENAEKRTAHCDMIIKETDALTGMVNELLELSKLQSNNLEFIASEVNASRCLLNTMSSFQILAEKEGYQFKTDIDDNIIINGNEQYLRRVYYNLISNAVNYTGDDKIVKITLKKLGDKMRFEVTDTGKGIAQEQLESIWERYYKSKEAHKRAVVGTGLGLSIVKSALELHGAKYGIDSKENVGSTFWFEL